MDDAARRAFTRKPTAVVVHPTTPYLGPAILAQLGAPYGG